MEVVGGSSPQHLEIMREPNSGKIVEREKENIGISDEVLNGERMSVAQFRGYIATLGPEEVIPEFKKLVIADRLLNKRATFLELKRLGYSVELEDNNITLKENEDEKGKDK